MLKVEKGQRSDPLWEIVAKEAILWFGNKPTEISPQSLSSFPIPNVEVYLKKNNRIFFLLWLMFETIWTKEDISFIL